MVFINDCNGIFAIWNSAQYAHRASYFVELCSHLLYFMERLANAISARDPLFECRVVPVGSAYEGTKIRYLDEFDVDFILTAFSSHYKVVTSPSCPPGFVHLKRKNLEIFRPFLFEDNPFYNTENKYLNTIVVRREFERRIKEILREAEFWNDEEYFEVCIERDRDLYTLPSRSVCITVELVLKRPIKGVLVLHTVTV